MKSSLRLIATAVLGLAVLTAIPTTAPSAPSAPVIVASGDTPWG
jgi:hypothetical protein